MPTEHSYVGKVNKNGTIDTGHKYRALRNTNLKEVYIVRYTDDFIIACRDFEDARNIKIATEMYEKLRELIKEIQNCSDSKSEYQLITRYNVAIMGYHNYYKIATDVNLDMAALGWKIDRILTNRLKDRISRKGNITEKYIDRKVDFTNVLTMMKIAGNAESVEFADNRISKYYAQNGRCAHTNSCYRFGNNK